MPETRELESELKDIQNWSHVSFKRNIIDTLNSHLENGERVENVLEGFYQGLRITGTGSGAPGILCLTDRRLMFLISGKSRNPPEAIEYDQVQSVRRHRGYSATRLTLELPEAEVTLTAVLNTNQVNSFVADLTTKIEGPVDEADGSDKSEAHRKISNLSFLHREAKKIFVTVNDYKQFNNEPAFLKQITDDLLALSYLCLEGEAVPPEETRLFVSMVLMPLRQRIVNNRELVEDLFRYETLPLHHRKAILSHWQTFNNEVQKTGRSGVNGHFKTLAYLRSFDTQQSTSHVDRLAAAFYSFAQCAIKADGTVSDAETATLGRIRSMIYPEPVAEEKKERKKAVVKEAESAEEAEESLDQVMQKIDQLIGMTRIKEQIQTFVNLVTVQQERERRNLPVTPVSMHAVFYGPPGTGKTTIARLLGKVYRCIGLLESGHLVETDRAGLVAGYVGQTAIKIDEVVEEAMDGVLFIDEAYTLALGKGDKDFGQEAIDVLLKRMEDNRERLAVIVAGYPDEMKRFINSNPGLKSRFNRYFYFDHYEPAQLLQIFDIFMKNASFTITGPGRRALLTLLTEFHERRDKRFGNGRLVRNIFERMVERQANRIASVSPLTDAVLCSLTKSDVPRKEDFDDETAV
jgi:hypothetical protein